MKSDTESQLLNELKVLTKDIAVKNKRIQEIILLMDLSSEMNEEIPERVYPSSLPESTKTTVEQVPLPVNRNRIVINAPNRVVKSPTVAKPPKELNVFMLFCILGVVIAFLAIYVLGKAYINVIPDFAKAMFVYVLATILLALSFKLNKRGKELLYGLGQSFYLFGIMIGYVYYHLTTPLTSFLLILIWLLSFNILEMKYNPLFMNLLVTQVASLFLILYLSSESLLFAGIYSLVLIVFNKYRITNIDVGRQQLLLHGASYFNLMLLIFRILVLF